MAHEVFISHSAKDRAVADKVCAALEAAGVACWIAPRDILPSQIWAEAIVDAIDSSRLMIAVISANANESGQIKREVERADAHDVKLVPFLVEKVTPSKFLEYYIGNTHWFDASEPPLDEHLGKLVRAVKKLLGRPDDAPTKAPAPPEVDTTARADAPVREGTPTREVAATPPAVSTNTDEAADGARTGAAKNTRDEAAGETPGAGRGLAPSSVPDAAARGQAKNDRGESAAPRTESARAVNPPSPGRRSPLLWVGVGVAALALVGLAFFVVNSPNKPGNQNNQTATATATPTPAPTSDPAQGLKGEQLAAFRWREGFQSLIDGDYGRAVGAFEAADKAVPQYLSAYDIARLLRQSNLDDPDRRREVFRTIATKYSYKAPADLLPRIRALAGLPSSAQTNQSQPSTTLTPAPLPSLDAQVKKEEQRFRREHVNEQGQLKEPRPR